MMGRWGIVDKPKGSKLERNEKGFTLDKISLPLGDYDIRR
jgi:hypothetical protein